MTNEHSEELGLPDPTDARLQIALDPISQLEGFLAECPGDRPTLREFVDAFTRLANDAFSGRLDELWWNSERHSGSLLNFCDTVPIRDLLEHIVVAETITAIGHSIDQLDDTDDGRLGLTL